MIFFVLGTIILINIIVAHVIDMYSSIDNLYKEKEEAKEKINHERRDSSYFGHLESSDDIEVDQEVLSEPINTVRNHHNHIIEVGKLGSSFDRDNQSPDSE